MQEVRGSSPLSSTLTEVVAPIDRPQQYRRAGYRFAGAWLALIAIESAGFVGSASIMAHTGEGKRRFAHFPGKGGARWAARMRPMTCSPRSLAWTSSRLNQLRSFPEART